MKGKSKVLSVLDKLIQLTKQGKIQWYEGHFKFETLLGTIKLKITRSYPDSRVRLEIHDFLMEARSMDLEHLWSVVNNNAKRKLELTLKEAMNIILNFNT